MSNDKEKLDNLKEAIRNLEGVLIPYNIIMHYLEPLGKWLDGKDISNTENVWDEHNYLRVAVKTETKVFKIYEDKESGMYVVIIDGTEFWYSRFESAMDFIKVEMKKK